MEVVRGPNRSHEERLERLLLHVQRGWDRVRSHPEDRERARRWLCEHPSRWPELDALWHDAASGSGSLAAWLQAGAIPEDWTLDVPLHSVLASHPFACLSPWLNPMRSDAERRSAPR
jgi:hypothetical protein